MPIETINTLISPWPEGSDRLPHR